MIAKTKKWIFLGVGAVIIVGGLIFFLNKGENLESLEKEVVSVGEVQKTISITGSVVSESPIALNFQDVGRVSEIRFEVGDKVIENDVIAVLDNNVLLERVKKAKASLDKAIMDAKGNDDSTREAEEKVDNAEDYLEAIEDYYGQLVDAAQVAYDNASDYEDDAQDYYDQIVADSGAGSAEAKSAKLTLTTATNAKEAAEQALETARKNKDLNIVSADNSLDLAEESLETVESDFAESSRDAAVKAAQADYQIALESLEEASLKAPLNGLVTKINYEAGEVIGSASLGDSFGEMITKDFILEADIPESDVSEIKLGQMAEVTFDAFDFEDKFSAKVIEIEPASTVIQDVIYYKAKLKVNNPGSDLKEGMSADIDILVNSKESVLRVSSQFVSEGEGLSKVKIVKNDELVEKQIETGLTGDDGFVEILKGLAEGEEVYLSKEDL